MNTYYLTRMNFVANRAHVYNTARTCEFLNSQDNHYLTLIDLDDSASLIGHQEFFNKHQVLTPFGIISLKKHTLFHWWRDKKIVKRINSLVAIMFLIAFLYKDRKKYDVVYLRDGFFVLPVLFVKFILRKKVFFEIHAVLHSKISQKILEIIARVSDGVVAISHALKDFYLKFNPNILVSFCSASEPERFNIIADSQNVLRQELGLPLDKKIIGYGGNLTRTGNNDPYGIDDIIKGVKLLDGRFKLLLIGGQGDGAGGLRELIEELEMSDQVILSPWVTREELAKYILASDILVIPSCGAQIGNSPTKMFEYLSAGRPVVAANTQAISEVLINEQNALLVDYKDPIAWKNAIERLADDDDLSKKLINNARQDGLQYSWSNRGREIFDFMII